MSRIVPLLRHSPAALTTSASAITNAAPRAHLGSQKKRCRPQSHTHNRTRNTDVAADLSRARDSTCGRVAARRPSPKTWEEVFIQSLVAAGTCRRHRQLPTFNHQSVRHYSTGRDDTDEGVAKSADEPAITKEEYRKLVDFYHDYGRTAVQPEVRHPPLASRLVLTPEQERALEQKVDLRKRYSAPPESEEQRKIIVSLAKVLRNHRPGHVSHDELWDMYQRIHSPRARCLGTHVLHRLLHHLGFVDSWKQKNAMQRYFQLLEDCVAEGVPMNRNDWSTAIAYAGRWMERITSKEIKAAIETWMRMEEQGHSADHVTFNVLFDAAVRGARFALADTIYKEIKVRGLPLDRFFRGSLIYYAGLKRDGDEVRRAFREFVAAGEVVDTTIMNSVILALFRAGEAGAAEQVFVKMKRLSEDKFSAKAQSDWIDRKDLRRELNSAAQRLRAESEVHQSSFFGASTSAHDRREQVQKLSPIAPDAHTYTILIKYHASVSGDAERVWQLLQEMSERGLRPQQAVYLYTLRGFRIHGGYAFSGWSHRRLEELWQLALADMQLEAQGEGLQEVGVVEPNVANEPQKLSFGADEGIQAESPDENLPVRDATERLDDEDLQFFLSEDADSDGYHSDDPEVLGSMISDQSPEHAEIASAEAFTDVNQHRRAEDLPHTHDSADPPSSFLRSVSLQHPTEAALLQEEYSTLQAKTEPSTFDSAVETSPSTPARPCAPYTADAASSFLDSLSLRHLTNAALLPEGGTPLEDAASQQKPAEQVHQHSESFVPNYSPIEPDGKTSWVNLNTPAEQADDFDSLPLWRRDRARWQDNRVSRADSHNRPSSRTPILKPRPALKTDAKPITMTSHMALAAVRAFYQCCGRVRMKQVWDEIATRWQNASDEEWSRVANEVAQMERHASRYEDLNRASR